MNIRLAYDPSYEPPIPSCPITLSTLDGNGSFTLRAVLDTGADATLIPVRHLKAVGVRRTFAASLRSHWGESRQVFLYLVDIHIEDTTIPGVYVVGDTSGNEAVLGRNVLNRLRLLLDGPALATVLLDTAANT